MRLGGLVLSIALGCGTPGWEEGRTYSDTDGNRFTLKRLPRAEGQYAWIDAETIRYHPFQIYKVVTHDASSFLVKIYEPSAAARATLPAAAPQADARAVPALDPEAYRIHSQATDLFTVEEIGAGLPRRGQWRQGFQLADLNGDHRLDLVHGPVRKGAPHPNVFLGDGRGGFALWTAAQWPPERFDYGDVAVADFDADGVLDLALAMHLRGLAVLRHDGHGGFANWSEGLAADGTGLSSRSIVAVDWFGDGRPELVALGDGPVRSGTGPMRSPNLMHQGMEVYTPSRGRWELIPADPSAPADRVYGPSMATGDVDGDGTLEVLTTTHVFEYRQILRRRRGAGWMPEEVEAVRSASFVHAVAMGDFDGDHRDELVLGWMTAEAGTWRTGIDIVFLRPGGFVRRTVAAEESRRIVNAVATGDLDGDGARDLVALRSDGVLQLFRGDGQGFVTRDLESPAPAWRAGCAGAAVRIADLDGDGRGEVVASFAGEAGGLDAVLRRRCPNGGGLAAWRVRPRVEPAG